MEMCKLNSQTYPLSKKNNFKIILSNSPTRKGHVLKY